eukprot:TRINITY_DN861_c3_g1_i1.p1 TRINITY_DN861_c3_g1~~TRINITY_DN861_c3_g1_i1.p1  ORF type:complete len:159 (-),score=34.46 TRINITY_DN861_c3_g1_i1:115-591(-)
MDTGNGEKSRKRNRSSSSSKEKEPVSLLGRSLAKFREIQNATPEFSNFGSPRKAMGDFPLSLPDLNDNLPQIDEGIATTSPGAALAALSESPKLPIAIAIAGDGSELSVNPPGAIADFALPMPSIPSSNDVVGDPRALPVPSSSSLSGFGMIGTYDSD